MYEGIFSCSCFYRISFFVPHFFLVSLPEINLVFLEGEMRKTQDYASLLFLLVVLYYCIIGASAVAIKSKDRIVSIQDDSLQQGTAFPVKHFVLNLDLPPQQRCNLY